MNSAITVLTTRSDADDGSDRERRRPDGYVAWVGDGTDQAFMMLSSPGSDRPITAEAGAREAGGASGVFGLAHPCDTT